jgi:hypothetical protein
VYRYKQFVGSALSPSVWCDETELARMENGRYFTVKSVIRTAHWVMRARWEIRYLWAMLRVEPETRSSPLPNNNRDEVW